MKRRKEYEDTADIIQIMNFAKKSIPVFGNPKINFTAKRVNNLMKHPHRAIRWLAVIHAENKFLPIIEKVYYKETQGVVRQQIIRRTKNLELLKYASSNEQEDRLKKMAMKKYSHLLINRIKQEEKE